MSILKNITINILIFILLLSGTQEDLKNDKPKMNDDLPTPNNNINHNLDTKLDHIKNLKKKYESIIKENNSSKERLKKYNLYYYIFEILNIIFALFISIYFMNQIYKFYKYRYNIFSMPDYSHSTVEIKIEGNNENNNDNVNGKENNDFQRSENQNIKRQNSEIKDENNSIENIGAPPATFIKQNSK